MIKKFLSILLSALLAFAGPLAFAQDSSEDIFYEINDFSGMLQSHVSPYLIPKKAASDALNVRVNTKYGALAKRATMLQLSACRAAPVKSIHRYYKSDATKYIIQTSSTFMDSVNETTGACIELRSGLTDGRRWKWVTYKDIAIGMNGTDRAQKWDGKTQSTANTDASRTAGDLTADLGAPFAEQNTGSNLDVSGWYQYKVAFYDGSVYKFSNAKSNPILTGSTVRDITLTDIPLGPSGTTSRIIYRTEGQASRANVVATSSYYKVAAIADNITRTYNDAISDATLLADAAPTWATVSAGTNVTPPKAKFPVIHQERLFAANDPSGTISGKSTMYWSDVFNPDYFNTGTDYEIVRPDDGDEITVLINLYNILTIGKTNTWQKFYTETASSASWELSNPFSFVGCVAPYSAVNGTSGVYYLGRFGINVFNGQTSELVSDVVTDKVRDILETNLAEVAATFHDNQYQMSYTSKETSAAVNDRVLILDLTRNAYSQDIKNIDTFEIFGSGTDTGTLYSGSSGTDGKIYAHSGYFNNLIYRYKSDLDSGTFDGTQSNGDEEDATLSLGSTGTWASDATAWNSESTTTWLVDKSPGYWYSPIVQINASALDKLFWNETLSGSTDVTFAIRTGASSGAVSAAAWSSEFSSPSGSDISNLTANSYIQIRAKLTTSDFTQTPYVTLEDSFIIKLTYNKSGTTGETSVLSFWKSGFTDLDAPQRPKRLKEFQIHYTGTEGTLTFGYLNDEGTVDETFSIDLSINPTSSSTDQYYGTNEDKVYVYIPPISDQPTGRKWRFTVTENGTTEWQIRRIVMRFDADPYVTYQ